MKSSYLEMLQELLSLPTSPLNEHYVIAYIRRWAQSRPAIRVTTDRYGNLLLGLTRGKRAARPLVFAAHMDHPGFEARRMLKPRRLLATWRGGVDPDYFGGAKVRFFSDAKWVRGTIRSAKVGMDRGRRRVKTAEIEIDAPVVPGAIGMWDFADATISGSRMTARGCDDVAGVASVLAMLDRLHQRRGAVHVYGLFTRAEEMGFGGALAACESGLIPRSARVVAVEISSELPGVVMGGGPILRVGDSTSVFTPRLTSFCQQVADDLARRDKTFRYQRKLMDGGTCESTVYGARGFDTTGLCLALGNYHNMNRRRKRIGPEYIDVEDFARLVEWFVAIATSRRAYDHRDRQLDRRLDRLSRKLWPLLQRSCTRANSPTT